MFQPVRLVAAIIALVAFAGASGAWAASPVHEIIPFTVKTSNTPGNAYTYTFSLWNAASGGAKIWQETKRLTVASNGTVTQNLGSVVPFSTVPIIWDQQYWVQTNLGVTIIGNKRTKLAVVPYALGARTALSGGRAAIPARPVPPVLRA